MHAKRRTGGKSDRLRPAGMCSHGQPKKIATGRTVFRERDAGDCMVQPAYHQVNHPENRVPTELRFCKFRQDLEIPCDHPPAGSMACF